MATVVVARQWRWLGCIRQAGSQATRSDLRLHLHRHPPRTVAGEAAWMLPMVVATALATLVAMVAVRC